MRKDYIQYRHYSIRKNGDGYNAFAGLGVMFPHDLSSVARVKIAIDLWLKYCFNYQRFSKYFNFLTVTNRHNYSGVWGKLKTVSALRKLSR